MTITRDEAKKRAYEIPEPDREAVAKVLLEILTPAARTRAVSGMWYPPYPDQRHGVRREIVFPESGRPPEKVEYGLSLGGQVELAFPDGRAIALSMAEWVSIALEAIDSAAYSQVLARNYQRKAYAHAAYPLQEVRDAWNKVQKIIDSYTGDYGPGGKGDEDHG